MPRGLPEVPTSIADPQVRRWMTDVRQVVAHLQATQAPASVPSNLVVTPQAFSNLVQWTRSVDADFYEVLWNSTPATNGAHVINVGNSAQWIDQVGQVGIKRYYWVRAAKNSGYRSPELGYKAATTLAATAGVTPPPPPVQSQVQVTDQRTGRVVSPPQPTTPNYP